MGSRGWPFAVPLLHLPSLLCLVALCSSSSWGGFLRTAEAYKNYTVGGELGWYDKLEKAKVDYQKWADAYNFTLGDFLLFNSDRNHSIVQTYNATTYNTCNYDDSLDTDTQVWSAASDAGAPGTDGGATIVPVPLVKEGRTYFFSADYDGEQCRNGQRFAITVEHGEGLPPSLRPDAPGPAAATGDDGSAPDTDVPENFDHPKDVQAVKGPDSGAAAGASGGGGFGRTAVSVLVALAMLQQSPWVALRLSHY